MKEISTLLFALVLGFNGALFAQTTLYSEDFETGGTSFTLNTTDLGGSSTPNFWIINNAYTGGSGSLICFGFPFTYTIANTPQQSFHANLTSQYLHTMSIYGQADNIFCSSFAAADGFCIFNSTNICKQNAGINTVGYQNVTLKFYWNCAGGTAIYGEVYYSTNGGTSWTQITVPISQYVNQSTWTQQTISLPAFDGVADLRFAFRFVNNQSSSALDPGFSIDDIIVQGTPQAAQSITTGAVSNLTVCPGDTLQVPYTITGNFTPGNVFTAELSDAAGSFASPVAIGSVSSTTNGTITCIIPPATVAGVGYRIRVIGSTPATTGTTNVADITVNALPVAGTPLINGNSTICQGSTASITLQGSTGSIVWESSPNGTNWTSIGQTVNPLLATLSTSTYFRASVSNACGTEYSSPVFITVVPSNQNYATGILSRDTLCDGDTTTIQMTYHGNSITWYTSTNGGTTWNLSANTDPFSYHTSPLSGLNQNMVRAIVDNGPCGFDTIVVAITVEHVAALFSETHVGPAFTFTDASTNAVTWAWDFGDGNTSTQQHPVHTYASSGNYTVTLTVTGPLGCTAVGTQSVSVPVGIAQGMAGGLTVYPNPFVDVFALVLTLPTSGDLQLAVFDLQGRCLGKYAQADAPAGACTVRSDAFLGEIADGTYLLRVQVGDAMRCTRLVKMRN